MEKLIKILIRLQPKAIFVDCFDTIIHRDCNNGDLELMWSKKIIDEYGLNITGNKLVELRHFYFKKLTPIMHSPRLEDVCKNIFSLLSREMKVKVAMDTFVQYCIQTEIDIEKKHQFLDQDIISVFEYAEKRNIKCYVVSDFYLGKEILSDFLKGLSIQNKIEDIFVSCDCNARKDYLGNLYKVVCERLKADPSECIMIGDNYTSDYINARKQGLEAFFKRYEINTYAHNKEWINKKLFDICKKAKQQNEFALYAFSLYLFIDRLYESIKSSHITDVLFFSREGQFLKKIFDLYLQNKNDKSVRSHYIYISRLSSYDCGLKDIDQEDFHILSRQYPKMSVGSFLKNIGLYEYVENIGVDKDDAENIENNFFKSDKFKELINNNIFKELYEENRNRKRELFNKYINSLGIDLSKEIAVVDIGWKGTIQDNFFYALSGRIKIKGFYIGLTDFGDASYSNKKYGLLWETFYNKSMNTIHWEMLESYIFEALLQANHSQVISYECKKDIVVPVFADDVINLSYKRVESLLDEIVHVFNELIQLFDNNIIKPNDVSEVFDNIQKEFVYKYSLKKACLLKKLCPIKDCDSFGQFLSMKNGCMISLLRSIKNFGLFSNRTFDRVLASQNVIMIVMYSKLFCLAKKIYE